MKQRTLAMMTGFEQYTRKTRRAIFLEEMEQVVPWRELCALVEPHYPQPGNGRPPVGVERMLRIYFLQQWFNLSDPAVEEALYDSAGMRQFVGIDLGCEPVPDETTVCKFRHLLEEHQLGEQILGQVNLHLQAQGVRITTGTIVDATILHAPTSTKNREQQRDPEMHQTKKGKQWYFGMKAHVGVDSKTKIIHTAVATAANVADSAVLPDLLHGEETRVWGDQAYRGQTEVIRESAGEEPDEVDGGLEGGARACGDEAEVRICEATLSRTEEECHPTVRGVRAGESVLGAEKTVALGTGLARERRLLITGEPPKQAEDRKKPNPSACTGLAEHLLPRRHGLIQSFPREIDLALQKVAEIAPQFRAALGEIHANEKIPEIALVKKSHAESQRVLAQVIEIAKVICGSDINFRAPFLSDVTEVVRIASRTPPKMPSPEKITLPFSSMGILGIETQHQDAVVTTAAVRVGGITQGSKVRHAAATTFQFSTC